MSPSCSYYRKIGSSPNEHSFRPAIGVPITSVVGATITINKLKGLNLLRVLIVDGQNNHAWEETTPVLKKLLEETGRFTVDLATTPPKGADMSSFQPNFAAYAVVVSNYNGDPWPAATTRAFEEYVRNGGGFVSYHAADNAFPEWKAYQQMIAVGGWGNRKEEDFGPMVRWSGGKIRLDASPGICGHNGSRPSFY